MRWFFLIIILSSFIVINLSEGSHAHHQKKSAVVVGTVYCDTTCFQEDISRTSHFISGASVAVECKEGTSRPSFVQEVKTNVNGEFNLHLPFSVSRSAKKINGCSVKLIRSSEPDCDVVASIPASSALHLVSRKHGTHVFSSGFFSFKPLKQPILCKTKPKEPNGNVGHPRSLFSRASVFPPDGPVVPPPIFSPNQFFPPNPFLPPPLFPPNPFQPPPLLPPILPPPAPLIPNPFQPPPAPLIPNPFQPPPAPLIPNPFQPPPAPPAPLIPNPFQPPPAPPAPWFHLPPIPGLTPPPSPPPPPAFPFPLPPFHFPPIPGLIPPPLPPPPPPPPPPPAFPFPFPPFHFPPVPPFPGIPPASASTSPKKSSP